MFYGQTFTLLGLLPEPEPKAKLMICKTFTSYHTVLLVILIAGMSTDLNELFADDLCLGI